VGVWWWVVLCGIVPGFRWCLRQRFRESVPLLLFLVAIGTLYSLIFSNIGLGYRYRATLMPWLLIFAMLGVEQRRIRRETARTLAPFQSPVASRRLIGHFAP